MKIKSGISTLLRKMRLLSFAESQRFFIQKLRYRKINNQFRYDNPGIILPPDFYIYETYKLNFRDYYQDGKITAEEIVSQLSAHFNLTKPGIKVLDWGCGPGRVIRHIPLLLPQAEIYGSDYNKKYIEWCQANLPGIRFSLNAIDLPVNFPDSFFDLVTGLSVFTHLSEKSHEYWIHELHRIMKMDGGLFLTTQGRSYYNKLMMKEKKLFDTGHLVTRKYFKEGNRLFSSFQPEEYFRKIIENKFRVLEFIPGKIRSGKSLQDTWVLKKT